MKAIVALQELIKEEEKRIKIAKQQLSAHESGEVKLSFLEKSSTENSLDELTEKLKEHQDMLNELLSGDLEKLEEQERIKAAIERKNYYHYQKLRIKRDKTVPNDIKLEAVMIIDELPEEINFEDEKLYGVAEKMIELELTLHDDTNNLYQEIKDKFNSYVEKFKAEPIDDLGMVNFYIPIIVLHFSTLVSNIKENIEEEELPEFKGLPKYEDWWIKELWESHQAYFALFKWKSIVSGLCISADQKRAWEKIFSNWIFIKKLLNNKGTLAYDYTYIFDLLLKEYAELEEEFDEKNISTMESIIKKITQNEDFTTVAEGHQTQTRYLDYKIEKWSGEKS